DPGDRFFYEVRNKIWTLKARSPLAPAERALYAGSTLRRWARTFARSPDRGRLGRSLVSGIAAGVRTSPRPTEQVLAAAGLRVPEARAGAGSKSARGDRGIHGGQLLPPGELVDVRREKDHHGGAGKQQAGQGELTAAAFPAAAGQQEKRARQACQAEQGQQRAGGGAAAQLGGAQERGDRPVDPCPAPRGGVPRPEPEPCERPVRHADDDDVAAAEADPRRVGGVAGLELPARDGHDPQAGLAGHGKEAYRVLQDRDRHARRLLVPYRRAEGR